MKQTPLKRTGGLKRKSAPRRSQPKRIWTVAREKLDRENQCRVWDQSLDASGCEGRLQAAHVIGREHDPPLPYKLPVSEGPNPRALWVRPESVIPLCQKHHRAYDSHALDILPALTLDEQLQAVADAGGIELARKRLAPSQYRGS